MGEAIAFYAFSALILLFGMLVVTARNTVYSVLFLVADFIAVAGLYVLLHAEFLAVIQILVYAGGIVVLYLFVVMLVNLKNPEATIDARRFDRVGILLSGAVLAELVAIGAYSFNRAAVGTDPSHATAVPVNVNQIGQLLYIEFLVPFEVASVLLLAAMIGAIILARKES